jgi:hypothetical protein
MEDATPEQIVESYRTAAKMARAAWAGRPSEVGRLWNESERRDLLVWALAYMTNVVARSVAVAAGKGVDLHKVFTGLGQWEPPTEIPDDET